MAKRIYGVSPFVGSTGVLVEEPSDPTAGITSPLAADLDAGGHKITSLADPSADQEAATKKYVDDNAGTGAGDFMADGSVPATGAFNMDGNNVDDIGVLQADSVVDPSGTGPSLELSAAEIVATGKGTLQTPFSVDAVSGVSVNLQEWRVDGSPVLAVNKDGILVPALNGVVAESAEPDAPADGSYVWWARDAGSGKTAAMIRFPTGASVQIAVEE
jgi:hypothetical protein